MVTVTVIKDDGNKRILRCSNRIWYRLWIDMMRIEPLLKGGDRIWMDVLYFLL